MIVDQRRQTVRRRLRDADVARDHRVVNLIAEMAAHVGGDQVAQIVAAVIHRQQYPLQREARVERPLHPLDRAHQLRQALECVELALQRHEHPVGRDQRVDRQQVQRRRAIDQHLVVLGEAAADRPLQQELAVRPLRHFELGAGEIGQSRHQRQARHRGGEHRLVELGFAEQQIVAGDLPGLAADAEAGAGIALRVEVDDEHPMPGRGKRRREVDRRRGLADAALLVGDGDDARPPHHQRPRQLGPGDRRHRRRTPVRHRMTPRGSVRLSWLATLNSQPCRAAANSCAASLPFGKRHAVWGPVNG
jgi:hypothetical protein